jgi:protein-tyrosine kinase
MSTPQTIGDILIATGRLSPDDAKRIVERQRQDKNQFGEAALALKVLTKDDIDYALSKQFDYSYLSDQDQTVSPELVAAYKPFSRVGENLRAVRSQLMLRWFNTDPARKVIAVVSANNGEGRSFTAANLAIVFAQQGERTLLIDADMRSKPERTQGALFHLGKAPGLSAILSNRAGLEVAQLVPGLPGLAVLPSGATPPNPQELLGRATFGDLLRISSQQFDVVIIDTPAGAIYADAEVTAARAGAALLVARKNQSLLPAAAGLARRLQDSGVALIGSVLNDT